MVVYNVNLLCLYLHLIHWMFELSHLAAISNSGGIECTDLISIIHFVTNVPRAV